MKPHANLGIKLEDLGEINVATSSVDFLLTLGLPEASQAALNGLANAMRDTRDIFEGVAPTQSDNSTSTFTFEDELQARMVRDALKMSADYNPDSLVAGAAQDMLDGYNRAMDSPPTEG